MGISGSGSFFAVFVLLLVLGICGCLMVFVFVGWTDGIRFVKYCSVGGFYARACIPNGVFVSILACVFACLFCSFVLRDALRCTSLRPVIFRLRIAGTLLFLGGRVYRSICRVSLLSLV